MAIAPQLANGTVLDADVEHADLRLGAAGRVAGVLEVDHVLGLARLGLARAVLD